MGNEESMMAEGGGPGGQPGQANGIPGGQRPGGGQQGGTQGPNLGNIGLGNLSNIGSSITNTIKNQANQAAAGAGGLSNLASLGSNLTSNLTNQAKNLASNLDNITKDITQPGGAGGPLIGGLSKAASNVGGGAQTTRPPAQQPKPEVPDVDLSGLTEEEKAMIQSVMMRAQEGADVPGGPPPPQQQQMGQAGQIGQIGQMGQMGQMGQQQPLDPMGTMNQQQQMQRQREEEMMKSQQQQQQQQQSAFNNQMMGGMQQQPPFDTTNIPQPNMMGDMNQMNKPQQQDSGAFGNQGLMQQQPQTQLPTDQSQQQQQQPQKPKDIFCPVCRISILMPSSEIENKCVDCGQVVCKNCGMPTQSQFNEKIWVCVNCNLKRDQMRLQQQPPPQQPSQQPQQQPPLTDMNQQQQQQMSGQLPLNAQQQAQMGQTGQIGQMGSMQDPLSQQQPPNLGFNQPQPPPQQFNEQTQMFNDMNAMNQQQQEQNKMMDPMLNQQTQGPMDQQLRDPVTGQPIFNNQMQPPNMLMDGMNQMNKLDAHQQMQQFDPITGMPINQLSQQLDFNKQPPMGPYDPMNNMGQPIDPMTGLPLNKPQQQFNEMNNKMLMGDKMKQQFPPPNQPLQSMMDPHGYVDSLPTMQNQGLFSNENASTNQSEMGYMQYDDSLAERALDDESNSQWFASQLDRQEDDVGSFENRNLEVMSDENSFKKFLEFEQQAQLSKLMNKQTSLPELDEEYRRQGAQQEEESSDNEELGAIDQCQLDPNYASNQMNQMNQINQSGNNMLHLMNGLGDVYTIPEETEDEELTSPDSITRKKNLEQSLSNVQTSAQNGEQQTLVYEQISDQISIRAQTVEILMKTNETGEENFNVINSTQSTHRKLPQAGKLTSDLSTSNDQWKAQLPSTTAASTIQNTVLKTTSSEQLPQSRDPNLLNQQSNQAHQLTSNQMQPPQKQQLPSFPSHLDPNKPLGPNLSHFQSSILNDPMMMDQQQMYPPGHPLHLQQQQQKQHATQFPGQPLHHPTTNFQPQFENIQQPLPPPNQLSNQQLTNQLPGQLAIDHHLHNQPHHQANLQATNQPPHHGLPPFGGHLNLQQQPPPPPPMNPNEQFFTGPQIDPSGNLIHQPPQSSYLMNDPMNPQLNQNINQQITSSLSNQQPPSSFSSRPHTSHFSPQFQRKMPQIRPSMLRSKSKERELPYQGRSPFDSPTSVSSSGSMTDQGYSTKRQYSSEYNTHHPAQSHRTIDDLDFHTTQHQSHSHRSPKHIKYADDIDLETSHHHTPFTSHHHTSTLSTQPQTYSTRSDRHLDRHLSCESPTAGLSSGSKHHSKRSMMHSQSTGYHSLHTSPRKTPSSTQICNSEICHPNAPCTVAANQAICDECTCDNNVKTTSSTICSHGHKHMSPKHASPSKHQHHSPHHHHSVHSTTLHDHHASTCPQSSLPCSTSTCASTSAAGTQLSNMSNLSQHQQTFNAFHKQQEKLLQQQEMLVDGMKKIQKKKIRKLHEVWSPTTSSSSQLSPVDVGPLLDSIVAPIEKEIKKQEEQLQRLSELRRQRKYDEEYEASASVRLKSGMITGMLDDFNKQMEQLKVKEVSKEADKPLRSREEVKKDEEKGRRYSLDSKMMTDYSPPRKIENKKLPTITESDRIAAEIERNQSAIVRLLNARNAQAMIPESTSAGHTASASKSTLAVQPIKKTLEKIVSPVIDKTMHQQQLLITQQQQLIALQKEQNKLQQQLQEQLKKQQETQIAREAKLEKEQRLLELQKQQQAQLLELEHQEMKLKQEKQFQVQQEVLKREQAKKQILSQNHLQGMQAQIHQQQITIEKQQAMLIAQQNQKNLEAEHKKDELIALANNISNNLSNMVVQQQLQNQNPPTANINVIPTTTLIPPAATVVPGQVISTAPVNAPLFTTTSNIIADQQAPLITTNTLNPMNQIMNPNFNQCQPNVSQFPPQQNLPYQQQQPTLVHNVLPNLPFPTLGKELPMIPSMSNQMITQHFDNSAPNSIRTIRPLRSALSLGANARLPRKDRRRLPLPTYEEIQQATVALGLNNRLSGLSCEKVQQQLLSGGSVCSSSSGSAFKVLHTHISLSDLTATNLNNQPTSILHQPTKNQPVCFADSKITTSIVTTNPRTTTTSTSLSTGSLPHAVHSEMDRTTRTVDSSKFKSSPARKDRFSPQLGDISDTQSETSCHLKGKTLPTLPRNEVPVTMSTLKRLVKKDPFHKNILQRPSSSLDFTENDQLLKQTMLNSILNSSNKSLNRLSINKSLNHLSPYSSLSDIANLINQSSAVTLGRLSPAVIAASHASKLGALETLKQQQNPLIKTVKQQLKEELRTAISERKRLLELRNRPDLSKNDKLALAFATKQPSFASCLMKGRSETDLRGLTSTYVDPNIATDVSNMLTAQSNDYSFLPSRTGYFDDNFRTDNANSVAGRTNQFNKCTGYDLSRAARFDCNQLQPNEQTYLNDLYLGDRFKQNSSTVGPTRTSNSFMNTPIDLSNFSSTFSNQFMSRLNSNRLENSLSTNKVDFNLKETKIQDTNEPRLTGRASTSLSLGCNKHSKFRSHSTDRWNDYESQECYLKTTRFSDNLEPIQSSRQVIAYADEHYQQPTMSTTVIENQDGLKNRLLESAEDRLGREQRAARKKAEIERRKMSRNSRHTKKKLHLPSTSKEMLNTLKSDEFMTQNSLLNEHNIEKELMKEAQLANIEQLEQEILENELFNEELANQDLMEQHMKNLKILGQFDNFTGSYMPNVQRRPLRTVADDYFGTRRQKILARQQQMNRNPGEYALDDLYIHQDPRYYGNQYVHNVQTGGFQLNRNQNRRHISNCLSNVTRNYPHRSHLTYADQTNAPLLGEYPSRTRKLVENLTSTNPDAIALQNLHNLPATMPVIQTATSSNLYDASNLNQRLIPTTRPRYQFPIKRVFLTRESKERTAMNNGNPFGIQLIGGQPIPNTNVLGAFVVKIVPGSLISTLGELREGDQVLEWNGIPLTGLRNNDVQQILMNSFGLEEVEVTIKDDHMPTMGQYMPPNTAMDQYTVTHNMIDPSMQHHTVTQQLMPGQQLITTQQVTAPIATHLIQMPQLIPNPQMTLNTATVVPANQPNANIRQQFTNPMMQQQVQQPYLQSNIPLQHQTILQPGGQQIINQQQPQQMYATNQPMPGQQTMYTTGQPIQTTQTVLRY